VSALKSDRAHKLIQANAARDFMREQLLDDLVGFCDSRDLVMNSVQIALSSSFAEGDRQGTLTLLAWWRIFIVVDIVPFFVFFARAAFAILM
jgi:hypothetical protein